MKYLIILFLFLTNCIDDCKYIRYNPGVDNGYCSRCHKEECQPSPKKFKK